MHTSVILLYILQRRHVTSEAFVVLVSLLSLPVLTLVELVFLPLHLYNKEVRGRGHCTVTFFSRLLINEALGAYIRVGFTLVDS